jgi:predicted RNA-binding protein with PUA-like domain
MVFCEVQVTLAHGGKKLLGFALDAVELAFPVSHAVERGGAVEIENEGDIGKKVSDGEGVDAGGVLDRNAAGDALIDSGRVEETVADHDAAGLEGGLDFFPHELGAARGKEQEFGLWNESFAFRRVLEKVADRLPGGGATGLADEERVMAGLAEFVGQKRDLGGFPATLRAFKCDEKTLARHFERSALIFAAFHFSKAGMNHWLVKQEPDSYPWEQFVRDGGTAWTGVRNFQARNHLRAMAPGDRVLYYHSVTGKAVVGLSEVARSAYSDPTATEGDWSCVDLKPLRALQRPVTLEQIKAAPALAEIALLRQSRLSVMPVAKAEFEAILALSKK